jgi:peptidoglycan hydrolase-like protein with peptidoglycan-binding domain
MPMAEVFTISGSDMLGAASAPVRELQNALKSLGNTVRDSTLMALIIDGLIGPKTTAATNRAFTVHIGPGQADPEWRTGALSQSDVSGNATQLAQLVIAEVNRRGGNVPAPPVAAAKPKATSSYVAPYVPAAAAASQAYAPPSAAAGMDPTVKWVLIGLGVVAVGAAGYLLLAGRKVQPAAPIMGDGSHRLNNSEREQWINNDEGLYNWYMAERKMGGGMSAFIKRNREQIDAAILSVLDRKPAAR